MPVMKDMRMAFNFFEGCECRLMDVLYFLDAAKMIELNLGL